MKYIFGTVLVLLLCAAAGSGLTLLIFMKKRTGRIRKILVSILLSLILFLTAGFLYLRQYYPAEPAAESFLQSTDTVTVRKTSFGYYFDGSSDKTAVIFYPGGKVDEKAYAPMMYHLAEQGADCFLVGMPFRMPIFGIGRADQVMDLYEYPDWYLMGHSLGGTAAAEYIRKHTDKVRGLILLASYQNHPVPGHIQFLSVYGDRDGCLNRDAYEKAKADWPSSGKESVIKGGNHAGFGYYGNQKGDGMLLISKQEQQDAVIHETLKLMQDQ
jgi:hypothetical protein